MGHSREQLRRFLWTIVSRDRPCAEQEWRLQREVSRKDWQLGAAGGRTSSEPHKEFSKARDLLLNGDL